MKRSINFLNIALAMVILYFLATIIAGIIGMNY